MKNTETKLYKLITLMTQNKWTEAIHFAAKFHQLGDHKSAIKRAHEIILHPDIYLEMGYNPENIFEAGIKALKERYAKPYQEALKLRQKA